MIKEFFPVTEIEALGTFQFYVQIAGKKGKGRRMEIPATNTENATLKAEIAASFRLQMDSEFLSIHSVERI